VSRHPRGKSKKRLHPKVENFVEAAPSPASHASLPEHRRSADEPRETSILRIETLIWAGALLVIYACVATWGQFDFSDLMGYYNMQADAFLAGHLYIARNPSEGYLMDMVPFEGRFYLQWGPFPAVLHMMAKLAGGKLTDRVACILAGWLTSLVFLKIVVVLRGRYFPALPKWLCCWFFFTFALATPTAIVALRGTIYHESIAWAALLVLFAFWALLEYLDRQSAPWVFLAGAGAGLAILTRVSLGLYAAGLLAGVAVLQRHWGRRKKVAAMHLAALAAPAAAGVLLMMAYNQARFRSPWEYGLKYLPVAAADKPAYALNRVPENFLHYVLAPIHVTLDCPWFTHKGWQPLVKTERAEDMSSMFLASPFLLLGFLAWPLFRTRDGRIFPLKVFAAVAGLSAFAVFFSLLCFVGTSRRYMQDFVPMLMVLALLGVAYSAKTGSDWRRWQAPAWGIFALSALLHVHLVFFQPETWAPLDPNVSKAFVALGPLVRRVLPGHQLDSRLAIHHNDLGLLYMDQGRYAEAIPHFEQANRYMPASVSIQHNLTYARRLQAASGR
jgi:hypothetical protein